MSLRCGTALVTGNHLGCFLRAEDEGALCCCGVSNKWISRFALPPMHNTNLLADMCAAVPGIVCAHHKSNPHEMAFGSA